MKTVLRAEDNSLQISKVIRPTLPFVVASDGGVRLENEAGTWQSTLTPTGVAELTLTTTLVFGPGSHLDLGFNEARRFVLESYTNLTLPAPGHPGRIFFNSTTGKAILDNGVAFGSFGPDDASGTPYSNISFAPIWNWPTGPVTNVEEALDNVQPFMRKAVIDSVLHAVPGQPNTYYIDKGATTHGYNTAFDGDGEPLMRVLVNGIEQFYGLEATVGVTSDFSVVRSLSTGGEGPASVSSVNALKFDRDMTGERVWIFYHRQSLATP
jgi:hypothetical protein